MGGYVVPRFKDIRKEGGVFNESAFPDMCFMLKNCLVFGIPEVRLVDNGGGNKTCEEKAIRSFVYHGSRLTEKR